jgi:hypothetical protein
MQYSHQELVQSVKCGMNRLKVMKMVLFESLDRCSDSEA